MWCSWRWTSFPAGESHEWKCLGEMLQTTSDPSKAHPALRPGWKERWSCCSSTSLWVSFQARSWFWPWNYLRKKNSWLIWGKMPWNRRNVRDNFNDSLWGRFIQERRSWGFWGSYNERWSWGCYFHFTCDPASILPLTSEPGLSHKAAKQEHSPQNVRFVLSVCH